MFGLYVSDTSVYTAVVKSQHGVLSITKGMQTELPSGLIINGYVQDQEAALSYLKQIFAGYSKAQLRNLTLQVDSTTAIYRDLQVPAMGKRSLDGYVYNIMQAQVANIGEYVIDYALTPNEDANTYRIFAAAMPRRLITCYQQLLAKLGIKHCGISTCIMSLMQWMKNFTHDENHHQQIIASQQGDMTKTILFDGVHYVIANNVRLSASNGVTRIDQLTMRISELIQFQSAKDPDHPVSRIFVASDDKQVEASLAGLKTIYGIEVVPVQPEPYVQYQGEPSFSAMVGLAGIFMPFNKTIDLSKSARFDLLTEPAIKQQHKAVLVRLIIINLILVLVVGAVFWGLGLSVKQKNNQLQAQLTDAKFVQTYNQAVDYAEKSTQLQQKLADRDALNTGIAAQKLVDDALIKQIQSLAEGIKITKISVVNYTTVMLYGTTSDRAAPYQFIQRLMQQPETYTDIYYQGFDYINKQYSFAVAFTVLKGAE